MTDAAAPCPARIERTFGPIRALDLALYAAASGDHNPLHLDPAVAQAAGFEQPLVHGMLSMALAARVLGDHFGTQALADLNTRFTGVALVGDTLFFIAELSRYDDQQAHYRLQARTQRQGEVLAGQASVMLPTPARGRLTVPVR